MIYTIEQLKELACGWLTMDEMEDYIVPRRFTAEQFEAYRFNNWFYDLSHNTAGVKLAFKTDAKSMSFDYKLFSGAARKTGYFDILENGVLTHHIGGEEETGHVEVTFSDRIAAGEREITVHFPYTKETGIKNFTLDGSYAEPIKRATTLLAYGDSITHGYYAEYPSMTFAVELADMMGAELYNRGVGGDKFYPPMLELDEPVKPDVIFVAYGTNDWSSKTKEQAVADCRAYYVKLCEKFPDAKIFAVTPIWRADVTDTKNYGETIDKVHGMIAEQCADLPVTVIDGWGLVPQDPGCYSDKRIHPNDCGFGHYAYNLWREMKKHL